VGSCGYVQRMLGAFAVLLRRRVRIRRLFAVVLGLVVPVHPNHDQASPALYEASRKGGKTVIRANMTGNGGHSFTIELYGQHHCRSDGISVGQGSQSLASRSAAVTRGRGRPPVPPRPRVSGRYDKRIGRSGSGRRDRLTGCL
jgi:hypothetical protein